MSDVPSAIAFVSAVPLQHQIYQQLRFEIADGLWINQPTFPGEKELAKRFGVSVITTRAALDRLADEGWVQRQRGRGTRTLRQPVATPTNRGPALFPIGPKRSYHYEVLFADVRVAPIDACVAFGLPPGAELWQCSRLRTYRGRPHSVTHNAQTPDLGLSHTQAQLESQSMAAILSSHGMHIARMRRRVGVTHAPPGVATHLQLTIADPVLVFTFTVCDPADRPLEWVRLYLPPDQPPPEETIDVKTNTWSISEPL